MTTSARTKQTVFLATAAVLAAACGGDRNTSGDTAVGATTTAAATGTSTGATTGATTGAMAGMDHSNMPGTNRPPAKDANHEFLRRMSDHHAGLVVMAQPAMSKASKPETQADAHELHTKQEEEQKKMTGMIQSAYGESFTPMVMPEHKAMNDSLQTKSGVDYDRTFYADVIKHHQEGVKMVDDFLPRLEAEVKQMAEKMKREQQKEIAEFEKKMKALER